MPINEAKYGEIRPTPRNPALGALSDATRGVRGAMNRVQIPYLGGVGDLFVGKAPEELDNWAYGDPPFKDKRVPGYAGLRFIPELQQGRAFDVADVAMLGGDVAGLGAGLGALGRRGLRSVSNRIAPAAPSGTDLSRRKFLKKAGQAGAAAAVTAATPGLLRRGLRELAPNTPAAATRAGARVFKSLPEYSQAVNALNGVYYPTMQRMIDNMLAQSDEAMALKRKVDAQRADPSAGSRKPYYRDGEFYDSEEGFLLSQYRNQAAKQTADLWKAFSNEQRRLMDEANPQLAKQMADYEDAMLNLSDLRSFGIMGDRELQEALKDRGLRRVLALNSPKRDALFKSEGFVNNLKRGNSYFDPLTGLEAKLNDSGQVVWSRVGRNDNVNRIRARALSYDFDRPELLDELVNSVPSVKRPSFNPDPPPRFNSSVDDTPF